MACEDCAAARQSADYGRFNPLCLYCGARYWRAVGKIRSGERLQKWRAHIEDVWAELGHDRAELVALGQGKAVPFQPVAKEREAKR